MKWISQFYQNGNRRYINVCEVNLILSFHVKQMISLRMFDKVQRFNICTLLDVYSITLSVLGHCNRHREIRRIILNKKPRTIFFQKILTAITWDRRALLTNHGHVVFLLNKPFCDKKWFFKFLVSCFGWAAAGWEWATRTLNCYNHEGFLIHREK